MKSLIGSIAVATFLSHAAFASDKALGDAESKIVFEALAKVARIDQSVAQEEGTSFKVRNGDEDHPTMITNWVGTNQALGGIYCSKQQDFDNHKAKTDKAEYACFAEPPRQFPTREISGEVATVLIQMLADLDGISSSICTSHVAGYALNESIGHLTCSKTSQTCVVGSLSLDASL